jgi:hypothetical protein
VKILSDGWRHFLIKYGKNLRFLRKQYGVILHPIFHGHTMRQIVTAISFSVNLEKSLG